MCSRNSEWIMWRYMVWNNHGWLAGPGQEIQSLGDNSQRRFRLVSCPVRWAACAYQWFVRNANSRRGWLASAKVVTEVVEYWLWRLMPLHAMWLVFKWKSSDRWIMSSLLCTYSFPSQRMKHFRIKDVADHSENHLPLPHVWILLDGEGG